VTERRRVQRSVFVTLVLISVTMATSLLVLVVGFFALVVGPHVGGSAGRLAEDHVRTLAAAAPDREASRGFAARYDIFVRYEGPDGAWATATDLPTIEEARTGKLSAAARRIPGRAYFVVPAPGGGTYLFVWEYGRRLYVIHTQLLWLMLFLVAAVVLAAYFVLRRLLRPLRSLQEGVARLSEGHLDVALENRTRDEFGALTDAFNVMVRRVREMVEARDRLLVDVSHELRSPLTRMRVALALTSDGEKKGRMEADVAEMEAMITELLERERLRDGRGLRIERQDLREVLLEVVGTFRGALPGVRASSDIPAVPLDLDADKVRTVLRNVLENALKYSLPDSRPVEVAVASEGSSVVVRVTDDGPGIPEADLPRLFEPFFRVDRSRSRKTGGYGLGLSICKRIMEAHRGTIGAANNPGRGAALTLTFPKPG
jgi:signal transduction histidine kinase